METEQALSACMVITLYICDITWLPHLHKYNFFLCNYWQVRRTTRSRAAYTLSQDLLPNFTQSVNQVLAVTLHLHGFYHCKCGATKYALLYISWVKFQINSCTLLVLCFLSNCAHVVLLFPLVATVQQTSQAAEIKSISISLLNSKSCFTIFCFLPYRRQSTFYRSA